MPSGETGVPARPPRYVPKVGDAHFSTSRVAHSNPRSRHRLRRRLSSPPHKDLRSRHPPHHDRVQPQEGDIPPRSNQNPNIDERRCERRSKSRACRSSSLQPQLSKSQLCHLQSSREVRPNFKTSHHPTSSGRHPSPPNRLKSERRPEDYSRVPMGRPNPSSPLGVKDHSARASA